MLYTLISQYFRFSSSGEATAILAPVVGCNATELEMRYTFRARSLTGFLNLIGLLAFLANNRNDEDMRSSSPPSSRPRAMGAIPKGTGQLIARPRQESTDTPTLVFNGPVFLNSQFSASSTSSVSTSTASASTVGGSSSTGAATSSTSTVGVGSSTRAAIPSTSTAGGSSFHFPSLYNVIEKDHKDVFLIKSFSILRRGFPLCVRTRRCFKAKERESRE